MSTLDSFLPVGSIVPYGGEAPRNLEPSGWLLCDGRALRREDYPQLFEVIGTLWGEVGVSEFVLPDLRGQFLRTQSDDVSRDPDLSLRKPLGTGANLDVGSAQTYGTAPPLTAFTASITNLARLGNNYIDGSGARPARAASGQLESTVSSGGDKETRPVNRYVWYLIKAVRTIDDIPVEMPVGGVMTFCGENTTGLDDHWLPCEGGQFPPLGSFRTLFEAIGYSHGKQVADDIENFVLPDYRDTFLRGVTGTAATDPDADRRTAPHDSPGGEPSGNTGNTVGSKQNWATAMPVRDDFRFTYDKPPTEDATKSTVGTHRTFYGLTHGSTSVDVTQRGGDVETRPSNVRVHWLIRYRTGAPSEDAPGIGGADSTVPVGATVSIAGTPTDTGRTWVLCDGRELSKSEHESLYARIGELYGTGDSPEMFRIPDYRGRFLRGAGRTGTVGVEEQASTGRPHKAFMASFANLPSRTNNFGSGFRTNGARDGGPQTIRTCTTGGDGDTRPVNVYVHQYIRVR